MKCPKRVKEYEEEDCNKNIDHIPNLLFRILLVQLRSLRQLGYIVTPVFCAGDKTIKEIEIIYTDSVACCRGKCPKSICKSLNMSFSGSR